MDRQINKASTDIQHVRVINNAESNILVQSEDLLRWKEYEKLMSGENEMEWDSGGTRQWKIS